MVVTTIIMTNYELIKLRRFISRFHNQFIELFFHLHLMLHAYIERFDEIGKKKFRYELNKALMQKRFCVNAFFLSLSACPLNA